MGRYDLNPPKKKNFLLPIILLMLIGIAISLYYWSKEQPEITPQGQVSLDLPVPEPRQEQLEQKEKPGNAKSNTLTPAPAAEANQEPAQNIVLPPLSDSDAIFTTSVLSVSPELASWFSADDLIKKYITIVNDLAQGLHPYKHFSFLSVGQPFAVNKDSNGLYISKASYQRFDALAAAIDKINVTAAITLYQQFQPLFQEVYNSFSYAQEHTLGDIFKKAAAQVLEAPVIDTHIRIIQPAVYYKYADAKLEELNPVHKQMLRMGPDNTRIIQNKVRILLEAFISADSL